MVLTMLSFRDEENILASIPTPHEIANISRPIVCKHGVTELYLFGSVASQTANPRSDIDFIYDLPNDDSWCSKAIAFRHALEEAFNRPIDLVRKTYIINPVKNEYKELLCLLFVNQLAQQRLYRILPVSQAQQESI